MRKSPDLEEVLGVLNARHQTDFAVVDSFEGPVNHGAIRLEGTLGLRTLKLFAPEQENIQEQLTAKRVTDALIEMGYPAPHFEDVFSWETGAFALMTTIPGERSDFYLYGAELATQLVEIVDQQYDQVLFPQSWPGRLLNRIFDDSENSLPTTMRHHSDKSSQLLDLCRRLATQHAESAKVDLGLVHGDMNPSNIIALGDRISGIVDWDIPSTGDPAYDIVYLWYCIYDHEDARSVLWNAAKERASREAIAFYLSEIIIGFTGGAMTYQTPEWVTRRLAAAKGAMEDLGKLGLSMSLD